MIALSSAPPAVPRVAHELPTNAALQRPPSQLPPLPPLTRYRESLSTQPHGLSSNLSTAEGEEGTAPFKYMFVISFPFFHFFFFFFWFFSLSVCVLYILTLYKPEGCRNGGGGDFREGGCCLRWDFRG